MISIALLTWVAGIVAVSLECAVAGPVLMGGAVLIVRFLV